METERKLRAIQVGLGGMGSWWVDFVRRNPEVECVAYVEKRPRRLGEMAFKYDLPTHRLFTSLDRALKEVPADFLIDVTPPSVHEEVASKAFEAGLHVLGEKPISNSFPAAKRMVARAQEYGRTYMVCQNYRFHPLPRTTRRVIDEGRIGAPGYVEVSFHLGAQFPRGSYYLEVPYPLITDMCVHHFDMMRYCLRADPISVCAESSNPSWSCYKGDCAAAMAIRFEHDIQVSYHASLCSLGLQTSWNGDWRIEGPEGGLTWRDDQLRYHHMHLGCEDIPLTEMPLKSQDLALAEFVRALKDGREPECCGRDNLKSLVLVFAALESIERGEKVAVEEMLSELP